MQLKGTLYYYVVNMRYALVIFWGIMFGITLLSLVADVIFGGKGTDIYLSFSVPIYAFASIMGFWVVKNIIPYLIRMGITRAIIYIGTGIAFILLVLFNGMLSNTIHTIVTDLIGSGIKGGFEITVNDKSYSGTSNLVALFADDTWLNRLVIDVSIQFFCMSVSFIFGMIFYRYRLIGGSAAIAVLVFIFIYSITTGWLYDRVANIISDFSMLFFYQLFGVALVIYLMSHFLFRRLTI